MKNQQAHNSNPTSDAGANGQADATRYAANKTLIGTVAAAILGLVGVLITVSFNSKDNEKPSVIDDSPCAGINNANATDITINCTSSVEAEENTDFFLKIQKNSGKRLEGVSFYKDKSCQEEIPFEYKGEVYQVRLSLKRSDSVEIYAKKTDFLCGKIYLSQEDTNPLPFKISYDCKGGANRKNESECKIAGG